MVKETKKYTIANNSTVKKLSEISRGQPQKLPYFHCENRVEMPTAKTTKSTGTCSHVMRTANSPAFTVLARNAIKARNTRTANNVCFWKFKASCVKGRNQSGIRNTNKYKEPFDKTLKNCMLFIYIYVMSYYAILLPFFKLFKLLQDLFLAWVKLQNPFQFPYCSLLVP